MQEFQGLYDGMVAIRVVYHPTKFGKNSLKINASLRVVPVYRKHLGRARAWNIFRNNFEEYATTNETDFMGSVTMSPASGRQLRKLLQIFLLVSEY